MLKFPPFAPLKSFFAAAESGRLRSAAQHLGLTESAVSHQVKRLEEFLGIALFERHGRELRLTAAGVRYPAGTISGDVKVVIAGLVAWAVFAFALHRWLIGVSPLG